MKPRVLAIALALVAPLPVLAPAAPVAASAEAAGPAWVKRSNDFAQILLQAQAPFQPEEVSFFGVPGYDDKVADLGPDNARRYRDALGKARAGCRRSGRSSATPTCARIWRSCFTPPASRSKPAP
ncbi:hypothetical secreted protein [Xanthomonas translucens pv. translucens DSM 18974]|uniref:Hypothetical secreted protein n=1 Tax=Xanthomonas translucens pv. translucens DSM 18974 TaxID=1261556 RepID=A0A1C3TIW3_XANCT|nr:hypothetical protein BN444_03490 [Xanthomonas translucens pv. translucens DSM 18974]SCB03128.1 hypothetical secreted protein [Xanthomonas translucens pv. translucens DSM 18974]